jgi:hypothetical protein
VAGFDAVFQYGTTTAYGTSTPAHRVGATTATAPLSVPLTGLALATTFHFRTVAGSVTGADQPFTTGRQPTAPGTPAGTSAPKRASTPPVPEARQPEDHASGAAGQSKHDGQIRRHRGAQSRIHADSPVAR